MDSLSRKPCKQCGQGDKGKGSEVFVPPVSSLVEAKQALLRVVVLEPSITHMDLQEAQLADNTMSWLLTAKSEWLERPDWKDVSHLPPAIKTYWA